MIRVGSSQPPPSPELVWTDSWVRSAATPPHAESRPRRPPAALAAAAVDCDSAGEAAGVGSNGTQPIPVNQTSTHEWASRSRTRYSRVSLL